MLSGEVVGGQLEGGDGCCFGTGCDWAIALSFASTSIFVSELRESEGGCSYPEVLVFGEEKRKEVRGLASA